MLTDLIADLRSAAHSLRREPGFVLAAILALAVGIGCTATVFGMVNQLLLRPVPGVSNPDRAAHLHIPITESPGRREFAGLNMQDFDEIRGGASLAVGPPRA